MTCRGVKITTDKQLSWQEFDGLASMQAAVGGYIERVELADTCSLYLNEEGKLNGLARNSIATDVALRVLFPGDVIVGDVFIVGPDNGEGDDTDLSRESKTFRLLTKVANEAGGTWLIEDPPDDEGLRSREEHERADVQNADADAEVDR